MTTAAPTTADRIRSACVRSGGAMLEVQGVEPASTPVHHLLDDGSFAITVPGDGILAGMAVAAGTAGVQAVLEMTDYAPLPLREPVRSLVWIRGRLYGPGMLPAALAAVETAVRLGLPVIGGGGIYSQADAAAMQAAGAVAVQVDTAFWRGWQVRGIF